MGITLFSDGDRKYYRVTKAWNGKEHQVYVRIGKNENKALKEAEKVNADLELRRSAFYESKKLAGEGLVHEDGKVVGLQLQTREREGRKPCTEFKIRVKEPGKAARFKSVSVSAYGLEQAFKQAVEKICEMRDISLDGPACEKMLKTFPRYQEEYALLNGMPVDQHLHEEDGSDKAEGFLTQLKGSLQDFLRSRTAKQ